MTFPIDSNDLVYAQYGRTPLMAFGNPPYWMQYKVEEQAVREKGLPEIVKLLLENGASVNAADKV